MDEIHHRHIADARQMEPAQRAIAETEHGFLAGTNTDLIEQCAVNTNQFLQVCLIFSIVQFHIESHLNL